jgi:hypothetical protein
MDKSIARVVRARPDNDRRAATFVVGTKLLCTHHIEDGLSVGLI